MTEQQIIDLGFFKVEVPPEVSGNEYYYFYEYEFGDTDFILLSPANTDIKNNDWCIEPFNHDGLKIYDYDLLVHFMETINTIMIANK